MNTKRETANLAPRRAQAGYSLLELLVYLAILGLIISIAAPRVMGAFEASKAKAAKIQIQNLVTVLDMYKMDNNAYPTEAQGLSALIDKPNGVNSWNGPYLDKPTGIIDPWGKPYIYKSPGLRGAVDVSTLGADAKEGGSGDDQDIGSW